MINKQIYFYWGEQPMSFLRFMTLKSFNIYNPDWEINLIVNGVAAANTWRTEERQDNTNYKGYDFRKRVVEIQNLKIIDVRTIFPRDITNMSNVHIKDMLNWFLLSTRSCVVADMDILFCKAIDGGNGIDWEANVNICNLDCYKNYMPVSFMVSKLTENGNNDFYEQVYKNSILKYNPSIYESCGTKCIAFNGIESIINHYTHLKINKMDYMTVFPFVCPDPSAVADRAFNYNSSDWFTENTIGLHWYGGQDISQKFNSLITIDNFRDFDNTVTHILKLMGNKI